MTVKRLQKTGMAMQRIIARTRGVILDPVETFRTIHDGTDNSLGLYLGVLLLFNACMNSAIVAISVTLVPHLRLYTWLMTGLPLVLWAPSGIGLLCAVFFNILLYWIVFLFLAGAWIHLWVVILGGRKGILQTMKGFAYGVTPSLLFGWIPVIGILFAVWSFILSVLGIRENAGLSTQRAARALIVSVLIVVFVGVLYIIPAVSFP